MENSYTEHQLLDMLANHQQEAIDILFRQYYTYLCRVALQIVKDPNIAEDMAQEVFLDLWRKKDEIQINIAIQPYLKRATINKSINYVKRKKMSFSEIDEQTVVLKTPAKALSSLESAELSRLIQQTIQSLPERCRIIFRLSRYENMTYQEIANQLDISVKTVEHQISKALKIIRNTVTNYK